VPTVYIKVEESEEVHEHLLMLKLKLHASGHRVTQQALAARAIVHYRVADALDDFAGSSEGKPAA